MNDSTGSVYPVVHLVARRDHPNDVARGVSSLSHRAPRLAPRSNLPLSPLVQKGGWNIRVNGGTGKKRSSGERGNEKSCGG